MRETAPAARRRGAADEPVAARALLEGVGREPGRALALAGPGEALGDGRDAIPAVGGVARSQPPPYGRAGRVALTGPW